MTALAVVGGTAVPAGAAEPTVTVAAVVDGPDGPRVEQHRAAVSRAQGMATTLTARDDVVAAEVDVEVRAFTDDDSGDPDDQEEPAPAEDTEADGDPYRDEQWALDRLRIAEAWGHGDGFGTTIAVVDTGVDADHPDFAGVVRDDGFDIFDASTRGRVDDSGHGTHVAGVAAAVVGNSIGIAGVSNGAEVLPVRVLDAAGRGRSSDVARGVLHAAGRGADVINLSLGSPEPSSVLRFAIAHAVRQGAVVVAATGNDTTVPMHPAVDPWTVAVGSVAETSGSVSSFSGRGDHVDLVAPGERILSTRPGSFNADGGHPEPVHCRVAGDRPWCFDDGTSMAAPFVSATAAMISRAHPTLSPTRLAAHLRATAEDMGAPRRNAQHGDGLVDPLAALTTAPGPADVCDPQRVPAAPFADSGRSAHTAAIDCAAWYEIAQGTGVETYEPAGSVTRGQMASFIVRLLDRAGVALPAPEPRFGDVAGTTHEAAIHRLAAAGIVAGRTTTTYAPGQPVTRDQMAAFLVGAYEHAEGDQPPAPEAFTDVAGNTHAAAIDTAAALGFARGVGDGRYAPRTEVRRDQMATFLTNVLERFAV